LYTDQFIRIRQRIKTHCAVCQTPLDKPTLHLSKLPLTEMYTKIKPQKFVGYADLFFHLCTVCGHGQLSRVLDPAVLYGPSAYFFRTSQSNTAKKANDIFITFINRLVQKKRFDTIIDIGCSDLYLLNALNDRAQTLIGIDPVLAGKEEELSKGKIKVYGDFFENLNLSKKLGKGNVLILSSHTLEHVENPRRMVQAILDASSPNTICAFQFPCLDPLVADGRYDQIFHQHLGYFSINSFIYLINDLGGEIIDYEINYHHWGSLLVAFKKSNAKKNNKKRVLKPTITPKKITEGFKIFQQKMTMMRNYLRTITDGPIYGFGAALMLPILSYHLQDDLSHFSGILDDDINKRGLYYINLPLSIKIPDQVGDIGNSTIVITALSTTRSVLPRVLSLGPKRIIFPLTTI